jgi:hypothetical protein
MEVVRGDLSRRADARESFPPAGRQRPFKGWGGVGEKAGGPVRYRACHAAEEKKGALARPAGGI